MLFHSLSVVLIRWRLINRLILVAIDKTSHSTDIELNGQNTLEFLSGDIVSLLFKNRSLNDSGCSHIHTPIFLHSVTVAKAHTLKDNMVSNKNITFVVEHTGIQIGEELNHWSDSPACFLHLCFRLVLCGFFFLCPVLALYKWNWTVFTPFGHRNKTNFKPWESNISIVTARSWKTHRSRFFFFPGICYWKYHISFWSDTVSWCLRLFEVNQNSDRRLCGDQCLCLKVRQEMLHTCFLWCHGNTDWQTQL